jgi:hypothetical protein
MVSKWFLGFVSAAGLAGGFSVSANAGTSPGVRTAGSAEVERLYRTEVTLETREQQLELFLRSVPSVPHEPTAVARPVATVEPPGGTPASRPPMAPSPRPQPPSAPVATSTGEVAPSPPELELPAPTTTTTTTTTTLPPATTTTELPTTTIEPDSSPGDDAAAGDH